MQPTVGIAPSAASRSSSAASPPAATDWAWRTSPTNQTWLSGVAATAPIKRGGVAGGDLGHLVNDHRRARRKIGTSPTRWQHRAIVCVSSPAARSSRPPCGSAPRRRPHDQSRDRGGCGVECGGFAEPGGRDERPHGRSGTTQHAYRLDLVCSQPFGFGRQPCRRSPTPQHRQTISRSVRGARRGAGLRLARSSTVDHAAGRRCAASGVRRTTCSEPRNCLVTVRISSRVNRPPEIAVTRSTTCASPKRDCVAHNPVAGSVSAEPGSQSRFGSAARSS